MHQSLPLAEALPTPCGDCTACCYAMGVHAVGKPHLVHCPHLVQIGVINRALATDPDYSNLQAGGCRIHYKRPAECANYQCLYSQGLIRGFEMRPDRLGVVFSYEHDDIFDADLIKAHEARPGVFADPDSLGSQIVARLALARPVLLIGIELRRLVGPPEEVRALSDRALPRLRRQLDQQGLELTVTTNDVSGPGAARFILGTRPKEG